MSGVVVVESEGKCRSARISKIRRRLENRSLVGSLHWMDAPSLIGYARPDRPRHKMLIRRRLRECRRRIIERQRHTLSPDQRAQHQTKSQGHNCPEVDIVRFHFYLSIVFQAPAPPRD